MFEKVTAKWRKHLSTRERKVVPDPIPFPPEIIVNIFKDKVTPPTFRCESFPDVNKEFDNTRQLAYCLGVLKDDSITDSSATDWREKCETDPDEPNRLAALVRNVVRAFERDELKDEEVVTEVTHLAPFLGRSDFRFLLGHFVDGLEKSTLLDVNSLEGIARLMQGAAPNSISADDLIRTLGCINKRARFIHGQEKVYPHRVTITVSRVLDVMADSNVKGLNRQDLHEPLSAYLEKLKGSEDPYTVFQAAYAFQALQCVPDDESAWQATQRKGTAVAKGIFKLVGAARALDVIGFIDGLCSLQTSLEGVVKAAKIVKSAYDKASEFYTSGQELKAAIQAGLSFNNQRTWYMALRGLDTLLQNGYLAEFKEVVGNEEKQRMYQASCEAGSKSQALMTDNSRPYIPLMAANTPPALSPLLDRVQGKTDLETDLKRLRLTRENLRGTAAMYIWPQAKRSLQAPDTDHDDMKKTSDAFLKSETKKVLLLLGESGVGKSSFNAQLESQIWSAYLDKGGPIPLFINLPSIVRPEQELIPKHLRRCGFDENQIQQLRKRNFVLICDGYDESQQTHNLYKSNQLNQEGEWKAKMVISCRSDYLGLEYMDHFQPYDANGQAISNGLQEAVILPFDKDQIKDYIKKYVELKKPPWKTETYNDVLEQTPGLAELVKNPFLLTLSLGVLPRMVDLAQKPFSVAMVTRVTLYDQFVQQWLDRGKKRLLDKDLTGQEKKAFENLSVEGFTRNGLAFLKRLATDVFEKQGGHPVIEYSRMEDETSWKDKFFGREDEMQILRDACPLIRSGNQYRFVHRSILEYALARAVFEPQPGGINVSKTADPPALSKRRGSTSTAYSFEIGTALEVTSDSPARTQLESSPLVRRSFLSEPSILQFLEERVQQEPVFKAQLREYIELSKQDIKWRTAAANAITILVRAGVKFNGAQLKGIQIPGADLSHGAFDSAQLQDADLRKVQLRNTWLRQADLSRANMERALFGEWPLLEEDNIVLVCMYSPDGKTFAVGLKGGSITLYNSSTWERIHSPLQGHEDSVFSLAYSTESDKIVSGSFDKTVRLWDVKTGLTCHVFKGHSKKVNSVAYSPTRKQIASCSDDRTIKLWDACTGLILHTLDGHDDNVVSVVYSPLGNEVASGSHDNTVRLWFVETGQIHHVFKGHENKVKSVAFSPTRNQIASGSYDGTVRVWDTEAGEPSLTLTGHEGVVQTVVYSPSGDMIAAAGNGKTVKLWDSQTGKLRRTLDGHSLTVFSLAFSPSGEQIASGSSDRSVRLWDTRTGELHRTLYGHAGEVIVLAYSRTGEQIASGSMDMSVRLWDTRSGASRKSRESHTNTIYSVAYRPDGKQVASAGIDRTVRLWDAKTGRLCYTLRGHEGWVYVVVYSPSGDQIASSSHDKMVKLWDATTGQLQQSLGCQEDQSLYSHTDAVMTVAYSPDGKQIASGSSDWRVRVWDPKTGEALHTLVGHKDKIRSVAYSPSSKLIASGSFDTVVRLWDANTGDVLHEFVGHEGKVYGVAFSSTGERLASRSYDQTVRQWDVKTGAPCHVLRGHTKHVESIAYSRSGDQIVSGSDDKTVRFWDSQTGQLLATCNGHTDMIESIMYSVCGAHVLSSSRDKTIRVWDARTWECLTVLHGFSGLVYSMAMMKSKDGYFLLTGCDDTSVRLWEVVEKDGKCIVSLKWTSGNTGLIVEGARMDEVKGLDRINWTLMRQRGSIGVPCAPPSVVRTGKIAMFAQKWKRQTKESIDRRTTDAAPHWESVVMDSPSEAPLSPTHD
ncbi:hypothetical protein BGZ83_005992 [Gryganskiella cystojenkinii]|nr:hypothetical protein BGZ83_005992 [Gryganskiella cystojenkinii]